MRKLACVAAVLASLSSFGWGLPEGGQPIHGNVQIRPIDANLLQILQSSPQAIINWQKFNISKDQLVEFLQSSPQAILLNRVVGQDPSQIFGSLRANGKVFLVNPNGILFGPDSSVQAGSFLASTLSISDQDFLAGNYRFAVLPDETLRAIVQQGEIKVGEGGYAVLLSPLIANSGLIVAERGQVVLGATTMATLTVDAQGLLTVAMPDGFRGAQAGQGQSGAVLMTPGQMSEQIAQVVSAPNLVEAGQIVETAQGTFLQGAEGVLVQSGRIENPGGSILLNSSQATVLTAEGSLSANGAAGRIDVLSAQNTWSAGPIQAQGGFVEVSGNKVTLRAPIDVGANGTFLLDPEDLRIVATGGNLTTNPFETQPGDDASVDKATLEGTTGNIFLQATRDIIVEAGVEINFDPSSSVTLDSGNNIVFETGSSLNLVGAQILTLQAVDGILMDPGSQVTAGTVNLYADGNMILTNVQANSVSVQGLINASPLSAQFSGNLGQAGAATTVLVNAGQIQLDNLNVLGLSHEIDLYSTGDIIVISGSYVDLTSSGGSLDMVATGSAVMQTGSELRSAGAVTMQSLNGEVRIESSTLAAPSVYLVADSGALRVAGTVESPDINLAGSTSEVVDIQGGATLGSAGSPTSVNISGSRVEFGVFGTGPITFEGDGITLNVTNTGQARVYDGAQIILNSTAPNNVTFDSGSGLMNDTGIDFGPGSSLVSVGPANVSLVTSQGIYLSPDVTFSSGGALGSNITVEAGRNLISSADFEFNNITLSAVTDGLNLSNSPVLGKAGEATFVHLEGVDIQLDPGTLEVLGSSFDIRMLASNQILLVDGGEILLPASSGNLSLQSDTTTAFDVDSSITSQGGHVELELQAGEFLTVAGDINLAGSGNVSLLGDQLVGMQDFSLSIAGVGDLRAEAGTNLIVNRTEIDLAGGGNLTLQGQNDVSVGASDIRTTGVSTVNIISPNGNLGVDAQSQIRADNVASVINVQADNQGGLAGTIEFSNINITTDNNGSFPLVGLSGTLGRPGSHTNITASGDSIVFDSANIVGSSYDLTLDAVSRVDFNQNANVILPNAPGNLTTTAGSGTSFFLNSRLQSAGAANITVNGNLTMDPNSSITSTNAGSQLTVNGPTVNLRTVELNNIRVESPTGAGSEVRIHPGQLGRDGAPTSVNIVADTIYTTGSGIVAIRGASADVRLDSRTQDVSFNTGVVVDLGATPTTMNVSGGRDVAMYAGSEIRGTGQVDLTFQSKPTGRDVVMLPGSALNLTHSGSHVSMVSPNGNVFTDVMAVPDIDIQAGATVFMQSPFSNTPGGGRATNFTTTWGQAGQVNSVNVVANEILLQQGIMRTSGTTDINLQGTTRTSVFTTAGLGSAEETHLTVSGGRFEQAGDVRLVHANSSLDVQSSGAVLALGPTIVGGDARIQAAGNVRVGDTLQGGTLNVTTNANIIGMTPQAELVGQRGLALNASGIYGNLTDPSRGLEQAISVRTEPNATLVVNATGPAFTGEAVPGEVVQPNGVSASIYYRFPQSAAVNVVAGPAPVRIVNEEAPPLPVPPQPEPSPDPGPRVIGSREDLTAEEQAIILEQLAQVQLQLGNVMPSPAAYQGEESWHGVDHFNEALTGHYPARLSSATVETVVLSPIDSEENQRDREASVGGTANLVTVKGEDDSDLKFWRYLVEHILIWEDY